jgi:DNA-binding response OmpR family regulator
MDRPHILIVEDDLIICELLFSCLEKAGYRVSVAHNGESALQQIEEDLPAVMVLDLNLPGMNGLDVCRVARQDPWMNKISILMLTGKTEEEDILAGLEVGADDYMTKPFSPKLLTARVKALLRRDKGILNSAKRDEKTAEAETQLETLVIQTLGKCELRVDSRRLSWDEEFSPAQRRLMAMLITAPDGKIPQEEVQLALWPDSSSGKARSSFDSLLSRVRRSLDQTLEPFDSKRYLVVKRGYLSLENCLIDAHEFRRLVHKGKQQMANGDLWPAEISFSSAFSLWKGTFMPGCFGVDAGAVFQNELEHLFLESSLTFGRLLAQGKRYQQAANLLRGALKYDPINDSATRLLYQLYLADDSPLQASQVLKQYQEGLIREGFCEEEIKDAIRSFPSGKSKQQWLNVR